MSNNKRSNKINAHNEYESKYGPFINISKEDEVLFGCFLDLSISKDDIEYIQLDEYWRKKYKYGLRVQKIFAFIENLKIPSGKGAQSNFVLRDFQKDFIIDVYDKNTINNDGKKIMLVRRAILSVARKNGKTALIAALVLVHLIGPEQVINSECYSCANDREQAAIVFKYAAQIARADIELESNLKIVDSTKTMVCLTNGSFYKALSAEAGTKMGLNSQVVIFDELAQARNRDLYDALDTSMAAREEPLFITISTQSNDPQQILSELIDDGLTSNDPTTVCHLYAVPDDAENIFDDEKLWYLANPALGDFRSLDEMRTAAQRAKRMPSFEAAFRNLYLNQRVDVKSPLIPRAEWVACQQEDISIPKGSDIYLGLDLSGKTDLTALVAVSSGEQDVVQPWFWKPEDNIREHEDRDRVPYWAWKQQGVLLTSPGRAVQYGFVVAQLAQIMQDYNVIGLAYDRWSIDNFLNACNELGLETYIDGKDKRRDGALRLVPWGQGFKDLSPAIDAMEVSILERKLIHDGHPILTWNMSNAITVSDPSGNRKIDKSKIRFRIDGTVALAMAIGLKSRDCSEMNGPSVYETRGVLTF